MAGLPAVGAVSETTGLAAPDSVLVVTSLADNTSNDGACSLREAMVNADDNAATWIDCAAGNGADVIYFTGLSGQIGLLSDLPPISDPAGLALQGPGAAQLSISGNGDRRMFQVQSSGPFTVRDLTLTRASSASDGSAIRAANGSAVEVWNTAVLSNTRSAICIEGGSLRVVGSTFGGNATTGAGGGIRAVYNANVTPPAPVVSIESSTFSANRAGGGHALHQNSGLLTLSDTVFERNGVTANEGYGTVEYAGDMEITVSGCQFLDNLAYQGGALHDAWGSGSVWIENSRFIGNVAGYAAGVIRSGGGRALNISRSVFGQNSAQDDGGVINSYAPITITASTFYSNTAVDMGGVIYTHNDSTGPVTIAGSLFSGNHANWGGAIWFGRGLYITNTTFYSNTAGNGGALASFEGWGEVINSTFAHNGANNGASLYFSNMWYAAPALRNTIIADPQWGNNCYASSGNWFADNGSNLQYPGTSCNPTIPVLDPLLDPAGARDNGGPTWTVALQAASPAIDRVPGGGSCPATDQRGAPRPVDGDSSGSAACDSGAYEYGSVGPVTLGKTALDLNGAPLLPGDTIRYTLRVENAFLDPVAGVTITDTVPAYTTYVDDSDTPEADADASPLVWSGLNLAARQVLTFTFDVTVDAQSGGRAIENSACIAQPGLPQTCTAPVTPPGQDGGTVQPLLLFGKAALDVNGAPLLPGDTIRYTLVVTNPHATPVTGVTLSDAIPAHTTYVADSDTPEADADADPLVWSGQSLTGQGVLTFTFEVVVDAQAGGQTIANSACLTQPGLLQACTAPVMPPGQGGGTVQPVLLFGKAALDVNGGLLEEGDVIRYTLTLSNPHGVSVAGAVVSDTLPAHTTYVDDSDTPEAGADADPLVWSDQSVPAGGQRIYEFEVRVNAGALGAFVRNVACFSQPGLPQSCTAPVEPSGGGQVKQSIYLPVVMNAMP